MTLEDDLVTLRTLCHHFDLRPSIDTPNWLLSLWAAPSEFIGTVLATSPSQCVTTALQRQRTTRSVRTPEIAPQRPQKATQPPSTPKKKEWARK